MAAAVKSVRVTVARGRTVAHNGKAYGPGVEVELDPGEAAHLRSIGFLVNPEVGEQPLAIGPNFSADADRIKVA